MLEPLPFSSTDYSFVDYSFLDANEEVAQYSCPSSSAAEQDCPTLYNKLGRKELDSNSIDESFWPLELHSALEPTPIFQNFIPHDKSKDDAILAFVSLAAQQVEEVMYNDFPLVSDDEEAYPTVSLPHCKRRKSSVNESPSAHFEVPGAKRQRTHSGHDGLPLIRDDQNKKWEQMFQELVKFQKHHGHTCVPNVGEENSSLLRWVKRQRYQHKLKQEGKSSTMTVTRMKSLESIGFVWDAHASQWQERFRELQTYQLSQGHTNVTYSSNPKLATWVKRQRREFRLRFEGKVSGMTNDRIAAMNSLGFRWNLRTKAK